LRALDEATYFNVYRFGSDFQHLFQTPEKYSDESLEKALEYLAKADADLGGTEILKPLKHIYSLHRIPQAYRSIVLLTDGEIGNEGQVLNVVREHRNHTRFFPIGIGAGPNEFFIKGLARAGRGAWEIIYPGERIEPKVLRTFQKLNEAAFEDVVVDWGAGSWEQVPQNPLLYSGCPVSIFARQSGGALSQDMALKISGKIDGVKKEWEISISDQGQEKSLPVPVLWARERIRELEERGEDVPLSGSRQTARKSKQATELIVELSKRYSLLSTLTSFVAIEEREEKDKSTGEIVLRKVPSLVTVGWHGRGRILPPMAAVSRPCLKADLRESISYTPIKPSIAYPKEEPIRRKSQKTDLLMDILSLQRVQGGLGLSDQVARLIGIDLGEIRKLASSMELSNSGEKFLILSTAILLQVLRVHFLSEEDSWRKVIRKSEEWLSKIVQDGNPKMEGRDLMDWVEEFVRTNVQIRED